MTLSTTGASGEPAERRQTTRMPRGPSSPASWRHSRSIAAPITPKFPLLGTNMRAGVAEIPPETPPPALAARRAPRGGHELGLHGIDDPHGKRVNRHLHQGVALVGFGRDSIERKIDSPRLRYDCVQVLFDGPRVVRVN